MTKAKPNAIKLHIIVMILTLVCISCAPVNKIEPKVNKNTKLKKTTNPGKTIQNSENKSENPSRPSDQKILEDTISKLKAIGKELENQRKEENKQIAKIAAEKLDFLSTFKVSSYEPSDESAQMKDIKRILYSSLDYKKENIETLKKILETLLKNNHQTIVEIFLYQISWGTQFQIDQDLILIQQEVDSLTLEEAKSLLTQVKSNLEIKQRLIKTLNGTLETYRKNTNNMKDNEQILAEHFYKYYQDTESLQSAFY
ncbi:complement regulator-acquiring protein (plasmid) [Borreliella andersonii]|uniref:Complement regulator-acquiring protein n=1 Tax=Borrelia andersonii TaxID=42109 RepID=A0ABZ0CM65_BORAD|nr:complement regulator-acquiring protein [Borreliella andersonii]WNY66384.1 complement regulator-acquiring protein [Borreliella andersonii]